MHLGAVNVGQIVRLRNYAQNGLASGQGFPVIMDNQPTVNSLCRALAMRNYVFRGLMEKELSFRN